MVRREHPLSGNIGSLISCTTRNEDLIPAFLACLTGQRPLRREHRKLVRDIEARMEQTTDENGAPYEYFASEDADRDWEALIDALNEYAPDFMYFGAHPGDGADYGFWLPEGWDDTFLSLAQYSRSSNPDYYDGIKVSDLSEVPRDYCGYIAVVTDHGNVSLYRRAQNHRLICLWGIV